MEPSLSLRPLRLVALDELRALIARTLLGADDAPSAIGGVTLWPHQRDAVARLAATIGEFRGALLADDVGLGKTFVALAIAAGYRDPLVVAPAALRAVWQDAASRAAVRCRFASTESLSRGGAAAPGDLLIVDEAHHARNPATKRYAALASLTARADTLLLTATPIHNARDDLIALLALFLGARAATLSAADLARVVVRRGRDAASLTLPRVVGPRPLLPGSDDDGVAEAILALPPAVPAADAGAAHPLLLVTMIRQWASSAHALRRGIERRLAAARALEDSLDAGRHPTRSEIAAWSLGADAQQLAFPILLAPEPVAEAPTDELRDAVHVHAAALRALASLVGERSAADQRRASALLDAWEAHDGARLIAFTQLADTVDAYWRLLRTVPRVCALSARGGRIASGAIGRDEVLASFAPRAGARAAAARIDALVSTDLASEGLDLQRASVLVHLDLPWTPARLEQRLGRIVRPGSPHECVHVYVMEPPARAATLVRIRERLAAKLQAARLALGPVMPDVLELADVAASIAPTASQERARDVLRRWRSLASCASSSPPASHLLVAAARSSTGVEGWVALFDDGTAVASIDARLSDEPELLAAAFSAADGESRALDEDAAAGAAQAALEWGRSRLGARLAGVPDVGSWATRRGALAGLAALGRAPRSGRQRDAEWVRRARASLVGPLGAADERRLATLDPRVDSLAWLDAVAALRDEGPRPRATEEPQLRALLLIVPR